MTRKILAVLLALALVFSLALTACGDNGESAAEDTKKEDTKKEDTKKADDKKDTAGSDEPAAMETVDWYSCWDMGNMPDWDEFVKEYITTYFEENYNVHLEYHFFGSADYATKFNAALTSGTAIDLFYMYSNLTGFYVWYERNALEPLNDLLDEYGKELKADMPDYAFQATTIDGNIYAMPTIKDLATDIGFLYNETLLEELGLLDKFLDIDFLLAKDYDEFFYEAKDARDAAHADWADCALSTNYTTAWAYFKADMFTPGVYTMIPGLDCFEDKDPSEVFNLYGTDEYKEAVTLIHKWTEDNITPYDAANYDTENVYKKEGRELGEFEWGLMVSEPTKYEEFGWVEQLVHPRYAFTYTLQMHDRMHAISALTTDEKKVAAMITYNALSEDPEAATAIRFGAPDVHWQKTADNRAEFNFEGSRNADPTSRGYYFWYMAEVGNLYRIYLPTIQPDNFLDIMSELNNNAKASENMGFLLATTNIETEVAAMSNVIDQYNTDLMKGMVEVDSTVDAFNAALEANGIQAIIDEAQTQLDAFRG